MNGRFQVAEARPPVRRFAAFPAPECGWHTNPRPRGAVKRVLKAVKRQRAMLWPWGMELGRRITRSTPVFDSETTGEYTMDARVHFHCFKVKAAAPNARSLESLIDVISRDALDKRIRNGGVRLDSIRKVKNTTTGVRKWYLEFTRIRDTAGPGKTTYQDPVEDLALNDDEHFGEETAVLFLPDSNHLIVQYNHHGVRPSTMQNYFNKYLDNEASAFELAVVLDADAEQRFKKQKQTTRVTVGVNLNALTAEDRRSGNALLDALNTGEQFGAANAVLTISVGRSKQNTLTGRIRGLVGGLLETSKNAVTSAIVSGRESPEGKVEAIDLVHHKLVHTVDISPGPGRRLPFNSRKHALNQAYNLWSRRLK